MTRQFRKSAIAGILMAVVLMIGIAPASKAQGARERGRDRVNDYGRSERGRAGGHGNYGDDSYYYRNDDRRDSRQDSRYNDSRYWNRGNRNGNRQDTAGKAVVRTGIGAGIGAGAGAILGGKKGALIGATVGAVGGLIYHESKVRRQNDRRRSW
jgi:hypothetical protein